MKSEPKVNYGYILKYILIGEPDVGKSKLLYQFQNGYSIEEELPPTIGVEFGKKNIKINNEIFIIKIWDTNGSDGFRSITRGYFRSIACALVIYDISDRNSFNNVSSWINECKNYLPKTALLILVGNKIDLNSQRKVSFEEGNDFAKENNMMFFETSAKNGNNVSEIFLNSSKKISERIKQGYYDLENVSCGIKIGKRNLANKYISLSKYVNY